MTFLVNIFLVPNPVLFLKYLDIFTKTLFVLDVFTLSQKRGQMILNGTHHFSGQIQTVTLASDEF